jgi:hypothetical protein
MYLSRCGRSAARLLPLGSSRAAVVSARASIVPRLAPQSRGVATSTRDTQHKVGGRNPFNGNRSMQTDHLIVARGLSGGVRPHRLEHSAEGASSLLELTN